MVYYNRSLLPSFRLHFMCPRCHFPQDLIRQPFSFKYFPLPTGLCPQMTSDGKLCLDRPLKYSDVSYADSVDLLNPYYCCPRCHFPSDVLPLDYLGTRVVICPPDTDDISPWRSEPFPRLRGNDIPFAFQLEHYPGGEFDEESDSDSEDREHIYNFEQLRKSISGGRYANNSSFRNPPSTPNNESRLMSPRYLQPENYKNNHPFQRSPSASRQARSRFAFANQAQPLPYGSGSYHFQNNSQFQRPSASPTSEPRLGGPRYSQPENNSPFQRSPTANRQADSCPTVANQAQPLSYATRRSHFPGNLQFRRSPTAPTGGPRLGGPQNYPQETNSSFQGSPTSNRAQMSSFRFANQSALPYGTGRYRLPSKSPLQRSPTASLRARMPRKRSTASAQASPLDFGYPRFNLWDLDPPRGDDN